MKETVNHPDHYNSGCGFECFDAMEIGFPDEYVIGFYILNAYKYVWRHNLKNKEEDIKKAKVYHDRCILFIEKRLLSGDKYQYAYRCLGLLEEKIEEIEEEYKKKDFEYYGTTANHQYDSSLPQSIDKSSLEDLIEQVRDKLNCDKKDVIILGEDKEEEYKKKDFEYYGTTANRQYDTILPHSIDKSLEDLIEQVRDKYNIY